VTAVAETKKSWKNCGGMHAGNGCQM